MLLSCSCDPTLILYGSGCTIGLTKSIYSETNLLHLGDCNQILLLNLVLNFLYLCSWQVHFDRVLWWLRKVIVLRIIGIFTVPWDFLCLYHVIPHIPISLMFSSLNLIFDRVWKASGTCTHILEGHSEPVTSVSIINPGGSWYNCH